MLIHEEGGAKTLRTGNSTAEMFGTAVLGVVVGLAWCVTALPDYGASPGYIKVEPSYGPPPKEQACYPRYITKTMTKDVQDTQGHYAEVVKGVPTTFYAYITETLVYPKTIIQYSTMTAYAEPNIYTETKVLYDTRMVTVPVYMTESAYGYNTAQRYFTETEAIYITNTATQSYPMTNTVTKTGYETKGFYVTQTKVQQQYVTMTVTNPYYVTQYETQVKQEYVYHTITESVNQYVTMTVYNTVPEYHTVTKCSSMIEKPKRKRSHARHREPLPIIKLTKRCVAGDNVTSQESGTRPGTPKAMATQTAVASEQVTDSDRMRLRPPVWRWVVESKAWPEREGKHTIIFYTNQIQAPLVTVCNEKK
ncbi:hypothetical protein Pmani_034498 [Petrolisthes manimaculis]|uniref:Uncharacterized protein n=1 Tax=Petrolisthes manimaculis TaxID=1843537 RepID=A0AAE1NP64_9EUCA|nr:hypothetical protein Pmani_034498 [Petrolisthes manimaculis]